jgi:Zn-dependent metalloprotease
MKRFSIGRFALGFISTTLAAAVPACGGEIDGSSSAGPTPSANANMSAVDIVAAEAERAIATTPDRFFADARHAFVRRNVLLDPNGAGHVRFDRTFLGLKVLGGDFIVHLDPFGKVSSVSNALTGKFDVDVTPSIDADAAKTAAVASLANVSAASVTSATLLVEASNGPAKLAWEVVVEGTRVVTDRGETPSEMHVLVDAKDATVMDSWDGIESVAADGTGNGFFVGNVALTTDSLTASSFALRDPSRGNTATYDLNGAKGGSGSLFVDADDAFGDGTLASRQSVGVDAQFGTAKTWDYYAAVHGRNGIGDNGVGAINKVHYGKKYNNAFWSDSCFCMTYGDGDGVTFFPFTSLDVAGHEMTHGVTSRTSNLQYRGESGGLNEATSDIFGTAVEFYADNAQDSPDYDIGEKLYVSGTRALRYMYKPSKDGASADCWSSRLGRLDVHYSSGVANHFFYLLSEGSAANGYAIEGSPTCNGATVVGIGRAKAEQIWYRALTTGFLSTTNYSQARGFTVTAAQQLYPADVAAVEAAWDAVNVH